MQFSSRFRVKDKFRYKFPFVSKAVEREELGISKLQSFIFALKVLLIYEIRLES